MKKFFKGFKFAFEGLFYAFKTQMNMRFHFAAAIVAILLALFFSISLIEWLFILLSIALVISAELFNTAIEALTDLATKEIHPLAKIAKDCAAAAVLIVSVFALVVGVIIFSKYISFLVTL